MLKNILTENDFISFILKRSYSFFVSWISSYWVVNSHFQNFDVNLIVVQRFSPFYIFNCISLPHCNSSIVDADILNYFCNDVNATLNKGHCLLFEKCVSKPIESLAFSSKMYTCQKIKKKIKKAQYWREVYFNLCLYNLLLSLSLIFLCVPWSGLYLCD